MNKKVFIIISFVILALSLLDIKVIPFYSKLGLDFSNQYGFHHCPPSELSVYKIPAVKCQDYEARPYVYPPLLFQMYSWNKLFSNVISAYYFFVFLSTLSFLIVVLIWADKNLFSMLFSLGLFMTFPNLFLLERGNSDMFIVLFWSLAYWSYTKKKFSLVGIFIAISVFAKLYPVYASVILGAYLVQNYSTNLKIFKSFILTSICIVLFAPFMWFEYLVDVLPGWSSATTGVLNLAHSLKAVPFGSGIFLLSFVFWILAATKSSEKRLQWIFAGGIALCAFKNGVSFDYNLVTVFPLAIVGFNYLSNKNNKVLAVCFSLLFFTVFGSRYILNAILIYPTLRLYIMGLVLMIIPFSFFDLGHEFKRLGALVQFKYRHWNESKAS